MERLHMHVILFCLLSGMYCYKLDQLVRDVFIGYEKSVRPRCDISDPTNVTMDMALRQIIELDEPHQMLNIIAWIRLQWYDCRLQWNSSNYDGIDSFVVSLKRVWIPDITLYDNTANENLSGNDYNLEIFSSGKIKYNFPSLIKSLCAVDVAHFPFDYQACKLTFGSWAYGGREVDIHNMSHSADLRSYVHNTEWHVPSVPAQREETQFIDDFYPTVTFVIRLKRRPLFYAINLLFPCSLISSVAILGFLLPPASGEKVNLEITVMLSLAVFQLIVLELMPPTGDTLPFIGIYFISSMVLVGISCLATVTVLNIHFHGSGGSPLPFWVKRYIYTPLAKGSRVSREHQHIRGTTEIVTGAENGTNHLKTISYTRHDIDTVSVSENADDKANTKVKSNDIVRIFEQVMELLKSIVTHLEDNKHAIHVGSEWHTLALMLDRLLMGFYIFFLLTCGTTLSVIYIASGNMPEMWDEI